PHLPAMGEGEVLPQIHFRDSGADGLFVEVMRTDLVLLCAHLVFCCAHSSSFHWPKSWSSILRGPLRLEAPLEVLDCLRLAVSMAICNFCLASLIFFNSLAVEYSLSTTSRALSGSMPFSTSSRSLRSCGSSLRHKAMASLAL